MLCEFSKKELKLLEQVLFDDICNNHTDEERFNEVHFLKYKIQELLKNKGKG